MCDDSEGKRIDFGTSDYQGADYDCKAACILTSHCRCSLDPPVLHCMLSSSSRAFKMPTDMNVLIDLLSVLKFGLDEEGSWLE